MDLLKSVTGMVVLEITSAAPDTLIKRLSESGIELYDLQQCNQLTVMVKTTHYNMRKAIAIISKCQGEWKVVGHTGVYWKMRKLLLRPVVLFSLILLLITVFYIPGRVYFVTVEGNESIPDNRILEVAEQCGIRFGATRSKVRSESIKNKMLAEIPQIKWIGVNTQGCTAVISVRESADEGVNKKSSGICSIVAVCDGIIEQSTILRGNALCKPGMAVKSGQVLVSAYTDCGIIITAQKAEAEIFGRTKRKIDLYAPSQMTQRSREISTKKRYSLLVGKKQINFYKGSGISGVECVKMKEIKYLMLPGGFQLPVALICEHEITYKTETDVLVDTSWLDAYAQTYIRSVMVSGRILNCSVSQSCATDVVNYKGSYECYEMIGIPRYEEITE